MSRRLAAVVALAVLVAPGVARAEGLDHAGEAFFWLAMTYLIGPGLLVVNLVLSFLARRGGRAFGVLAILLSGGGGAIAVYVVERIGLGIGLTAVAAIWSLMLVVLGIAHLIRPPVVSVRMFGAEQLVLGPSNVVACRYDERTRKSSGNVDGFEVRLGWVDHGWLSEQQLAVELKGEIGGLLLHARSRDLESLDVRAAPRDVYAHVVDEELRRRLAGFHPIELWSDGSRLVAMTAARIRTPVESGALVTTVAAVATNIRSTLADPTAPLDRPRDGLYRGEDPGSRRDRERGREEEIAALRARIRPPKLG
jgi:hypothetical protein